MLFEELGARVPVMISGTITDRSGRTLSGQTAEAFWYSLRHARPLAIGLNCALGARDLRPHVDMLVAGGGRARQLPSQRRPAERVRRLRRRPGGDGLRCCGEFAARRPAQHGRRLLRHHAGRTSRAIADAVAGVPPRALPAQPRRTRAWPGLEPFVITPETNFVNVGERTNVTGSAQFKKLILEDRYDQALAVARQQVESGAQVIDVNMDEGMLDAEAAMARFLRLIAAEPDIARVPVMIDSSKWSVIEAGLKCVQGKAIVNSISLKEGEAAFLEHAEQGAPLRRRRGGDGLRRAGPGRHARAQGRHLHARLSSC